LGQLLPSTHALEAQFFERMDRHARRKMDQICRRALHNSAISTHCAGRWGDFKTNSSYIAYFFQMGDYSDAAVGFEPT
jgi:hypothetical protein